MGELIDGTWHTGWYDTKKHGGAFKRETSKFRNWITSDGSPGPSGEGGFKAEPGRYHLYVSLACPWAHRALIFRRLKALAKTTARAVQRLKAAADKPVAVVLGPADRGMQGIHGGAWCRYLDLAKPDRVVVMDGVGTGHLDVSHLDRLYRTLRGCAERHGFEVIADIEVFGPQSLPPAPVRLERQLKAAALHSHRRAAFDLGHHLAVGTEADRFWNAPVQGNSLPVHDLARHGDGARFSVKAPPGRIDITTDPPHPDGVELRAGFALAEDRALGEAKQTHGPGRYQRTWVWRPRAGSETVTTFELSFQGKTPPRWAVTAIEQGARHGIEGDAARGEDEGPGSSRRP